MTLSWKSAALLSAAFTVWMVRSVAAANVVPDNPTFAKDILPIFEKSCQSCHRPGQMAPFSLLTYDDARPWLRSIRNNVETRYMPPWHLDRTVGEYDPDPSLTDVEIATIARWVENGAPRGDMRDAPAPVQWPADNTWQFGEQPDLIIKSPKIDVPAQSPDMYPEPEVPSGMTEERYIKWIQVLPGDTKITHHVLVFSLASASAAATTAAAPDLAALAALFGVDLPGDPAQLAAFRAQVAALTRGGVPTMLTEYARGNDGDIFQDGDAKLLAKDATIRFQIHYHPNGETAVIGDQATVGIKFWPAGYKPKHVIQSRNIQNLAALAIAPGDPNSRSDAYFTLTQPSRIVSFQPHMHYRGKRMTLEAIPPDGQPRLLTDVNRFVWTWQITYPYKNPPTFPKGTVLHVTAYHDNSAANKENPDPNAFVGWGGRTVDEMNIGWVDYYTITDDEYAAIEKAQRRSTNQ
jgi:copper type II ascorbate-dependent monooxygenase-like protein